MPVAQPDHRPILGAMSRPFNISRRDFINGIALSTAGLGLSPLELLANSPTASYPPRLTGLRGSHPGSFEVAHALALEGKRFPSPREQTDPTYDLVVAGGGISGLAAAYFYRQRHGGNPCILVLDNHDDFGGHAKRNEFTVDGHKLITYGGSESLEAPADYSPAAAGLLRDLAIDTDRFYDYFDQDFLSAHKLGQKLYFSRQHYGKDLLLEDVVDVYSEDPPTTSLARVIDGYPLSRPGRGALLRLLSSDQDYLAGRSQQERFQLLQTTSYTDFLADHAGVPVEVSTIFRDQIRGIWGLGWDSLSTLEAYRWGAPGTANLGVGRIPDDPRDASEEPYIFHFPDGNAGVARALVRALVPAAVAGSTMEDLVLAKVDYAQLDTRSSAVRIRLDSTVVDLRHTPDQRLVDVCYRQRGVSHRVRARHAIYAGYHSLLPSVCSELPAAQTAAIGQATKVPLVNINVALRNWRAFANLNVGHVSVAQPELMHSFGLDFPVSMGGYRYPRTPDQPMVITGSYVPAVPGRGLSPMEQHKLGRARLYQMSFADFEARIIDQLHGALAGGGFDANRDIAGITVNRWPHGYAYEYNELFDDPAFSPVNGPHISARRQLGRISIANSDASAYAYVDGAIDAAYRAVNEQLKL